jgi:hypothetical protein
MIEAAGTFKSGKDADVIVEIDSVGCLCHDRVTALAAATGRE